MLKRHRKTRKENGWQLVNRVDETKGELGRLLRRTNNETIATFILHPARDHHTEWEKFYTMLRGKAIGDPDGLLVGGPCRWSPTGRI